MSFESYKLLFSFVIILIITFSLFSTLFIKKLNNLLSSFFSQSHKESNKDFEVKNKILGDNFHSIRNELRDSSKDNRSETATSLKNLQDSIIKHLTENRDSSNNDFKSNRSELKESLASFESKLVNEINKFEENLSKNFDRFGSIQKSASNEMIKNFDKIQNSTEKHLTDIRNDNSKQLDEMRKTVDEKLQNTLEKRLSESFKQVSDRLEQVHRGLGDMQTLASGVGDLKNVLTNVKTRGIIGEYLLENILEQMLAPEQYVANASPDKDSRSVVEFAIKLPGKNDEDVVLLPIDSKFPLESWLRLQEATKNSDQSEIKIAEHDLHTAILSFAKDISTKYISPPSTTDFAVMFIPIEGLYAEIMRNPELFERIHRDYNVTITGPTTLSAFLSSLNMGFRTLAVQKRTSEVWKVLALLKTEFEDYTTMIKKVSNQFSAASKTLENLQTTKTNNMKRKLLKLESLESDNDPIQIQSIDSKRNAS